jgi:hypothetical protein
MIRSWALCNCVALYASELSLHLLQCRLGLWQPEGHLHTSVHLDRRRERSPGLFRLASLRMQRANSGLITKFFDRAMRRTVSAEVLWTCDEVRLPRGSSHLRASAQAR